MRDPENIRITLLKLLTQNTLDRELAVQKLLPGSGRAGGLRLMGKYIGHRLVARPELDNTFKRAMSFVLSVQNLN